MLNNDRTIAAVSTAQGGAISLVRMSGKESYRIISSLFSKAILEPRKCYFGNFIVENRIIDEVIVSYYKAPYSYTGEDMVEISCHGSMYITQEILHILIDSGASQAGPGEFTRRAFLNGKMDLSEAEAVGDLIASESRAAAEVALSQMRGGYSKELSQLRGKLLHIASMLELELDFSEEDVEFASRDEFRNLLLELKNKCDSLADSFKLGNVLKNGIPVAIIGKPNVGKSTLLNALVGSERSIVSDEAGTTRDFIDETICIDGIMFRFIDTAGIRSTKNKVEAIGVERSLEQIQRAKIVISMSDQNSDFEHLDLRDDQVQIKVINKSDCNQTTTPLNYTTQPNNSDAIKISAKFNIGIDNLKNELIQLSGTKQWDHNGIVVSNARHYELLKSASASISEILTGIAVLPSDIISHLLRDALESIGAITGEYSTDEVLSNIFKNFCIGK